MPKMAKTTIKPSPPGRKRRLSDDAQQTQHNQDRPTKKRNLTVAERARKLRNSRIFPFLRLPPELRNHIYELALMDPFGRDIMTKTEGYHSVVGSRRRDLPPDADPHAIPSLKRARKASSRLPALTPALLATCKQVHDEASDYLYSQNLIFMDHFALQEFLATIGPLSILRLRDIRIMSDVGGGRRSGALTMLAAATRLTSLQFDCFIGRWHCPMELAQYLYRSLHFWMSAYGRTHGSRDAALGIIKVSKQTLGKVTASTAVECDGTNPQECAFWRTLSHLVSG